MKFLSINFRVENSFIDDTFVEKQSQIRLLFDELKTSNYSFITNLSFIANQFDQFNTNSTNTRKTFVKKIIYNDQIDFFLSIMTSNFDSIIQIVITSIINQMFTHLFNQFVQQIANIYNQQNFQNFVESFDSKNVANTIVVDENRFVIIKFFENINYFDFIYMNNNDSTSTIFIVNVDRHVFYRNVYVFIDRLKNLVNDFIDEQRVKNFLFDCFRNDVFIWYFVEYEKLQKQILRVDNLKIWYITLKNRFKKRNFVVLLKLQIEKYTMMNTRNDKTFRVYV